jgi:1-acyl-sn-glycerol-3-phosphate acyltransferase
MLLTQLGIERLWGGGPEGGWPFMRYWVRPATMWLAPGSCGYGLDRVPESGGFVLAANHLSAIDPPLVGIFSRRAIWYMMKAELAELPLVGEALTWSGAFPIRRGESDREGVRRARQLVRNGHAVGIFAEGTRQRFGHPGPVKPGAAMIAMQEEVPIVPVGLDSFGWSLTNRRACCVVFGAPLRFEGVRRNGRGYKLASEHLGEELVRLWRLAATAAAAGFPETLADGSHRSGPVLPGGGTVAPDGIPNVSALVSTGRPGGRGGRRPGR